MKKLLLLSASLLSVPLYAQHDDHGAAPATPPAKDAHAGHGSASTDPHAVHTTEAAADPHAGHTMPTAEASVAPEHAGHTQAAPSDVPPPREALSGPEHAADLYFDPDVMASAREMLRNENGDFRTAWFSFDRLERRIDEDGDSQYRWEADGWYGGDINKLWIKSEGEGLEGNLERAEVQALWSRAIAPWWDVQMGIRYDMEPGPERAHIVLGLQGLAPYHFETEVTAFVSEDGDMSARFETEYDLWITQRLILQPRLDIGFSAETIPELGIGSGVTAGLGIRLQYQVVREFTPYLGVEYERAFDGAARMSRAIGDKDSEWSYVLGVRAWF